MSNASEQRPAPRFKVGQVVAIVSLKDQLIRINDMDFYKEKWWYKWRQSVSLSESNLRSLSIEEIGSDEVMALLQSERLMREQTERELLVEQRKYAASRGLCRRMLEACKDADATLCDCRHDTHRRTESCNCDIHAAHRLLRAAIYEAALKDGQ